MTELHVGDRAPAFQLPDQDGQPVSTQDLSGQRTLLYFFPKADTSG